MDQTLAGITEIVRERLQCGPQDLLQRIGVETASELPSMDNATTLLERLQRERKGIGPVNLRVEQELAEIDEKIKGMVTEQEDLTAAIAKLRRGISELNRESRDRLLKAFERAQDHFRDLFGRLFGGGLGKAAADG